MALVSDILKWALLAGGYLALTGSPATPEYVAAALVSATALVISRLIRAKGAHRVSLRAPWPAIAGRMLYSLLRDSVLVGAALARSLHHGHTGRLVCEPDAVDRYPGETRGARCAVAILQESVAPNTFVVEADGARLRIHHLA